MGKILDKKNTRNIIVILSFIVLSYISISLLIHTHILFGAGDMQFHTRRLTELRDSFNNFDFFPKYSFNEFHGSAIMSMYPELNLLPLVVFSYFIKSKVILFYVSFAFCIFLLFLVSYYSSLRYSNSYLTSYLFSVFYGMSTLYLDYGFSDMDVGMLFVLTFLPLVMFGFIYLVKYDKWVELSVGMSLILLSHVLSVFIVAAFLLLWLIINFKVINKRLIKQLGKAITLTICTTSIFWIPFIYIMLHNIGEINRPGAATLYGTKFSTIIFGSIEGKETYGLSIFAIIGLIVAICLFKHLRAINKQMLLLALVITFICSDLFPWNLTKHGIFGVLRGFQFTWRFYFIPQILLCYLMAACFVYLLRYIKLKKLIISSVLFLIVIFQLISQINIINDNYKSNAFTQKFVNNNSYIMKGGIHHHTIYVYSLNIPSPGPRHVRHPGYYKVKNNKQYKCLVNPYVGEGTMIDYFPMESLPMVNNIVNNKIYYKNSNKDIKYIGFNKFMLQPKNNIKSRVYLPFVLYGGEHLQVDINGKPVKYYSNKYHVIILNGLKKGKNVINIHRISNKFEDLSCTILLVISAICYLYEIYRKVNSIYKL